MVNANYASQNAKTAPPIRINVLNVSLTFICMSQAVIVPVLLVLLLLLWESNACPVIIYVVSVRTVRIVQLVILDIFYSTASVTKTVLPFQLSIINIRVSALSVNHNVLAVWIHPFSALHVLLANICIIHKRRSVYSSVTLHILRNKIPVSGVRVRASHVTALTTFVPAA